MTDAIETNDTVETIFSTIKKLLGLTSTYTAFDTDIMIHIKMAVAQLIQIGAIDEEVVVDNESEWDDLDVPDNILGMVQDYIYMKVRYAFDPPQNSIAMEALKNQMQELEWRINFVLDVSEE